jgi:hypothetical protein
MAISKWQLNPFERVMFKVALALAGILVAIRIGAIILASFYSR